MSETSRKHKAKFKRKSPHQEFNVGDLVMIRNQRSKNQARETFIVEILPSVDQKFILIRKLNNSLRPRLYKALPGELIPATNQRC